MEREKRVQIVIIENGKYILLRHHFKKENRYFWGLPGGGAEPGETEEEAAVREAKEETGLTVKLLPLKYEKEMYDSIYKQAVTFLAYPVEGIASVGYEPEEEVADLYELVDLKWQNFYDDDGIDGITLKYIKPIREYLANSPFTKRAGALVYRKVDNIPQYLLVSSKNRRAFVFPQGHAEPGEHLIHTAERETLEESGVECRIIKELGFFFNEKRGEISETHIFAAEFISQMSANEGREVRWVTIDEVRDMQIPREYRRFLYEFHDELMRNY